MFTERQSRRPLALQAVDRDLNDEFLTSRNSGLGISRPVAWMTHLVNALPARKNKSSPEESLYGAPHIAVLHNAAEFGIEQTVREGSFDTRRLCDGGSGLATLGQERGELPRQHQADRCGIWIANDSSDSHTETSSSTTNTVGVAAVVFGTWIAVPDST